jgi:hypothetical protein
VACGKRRNYCKMPAAPAGVTEVIQRQARRPQLGTSSDGGPIVNAGRHARVTTHWRVRRIGAGEGLRLRDFRLHALAAAPTAFGSTLAREEAYAEEVWHQRATEGAAGIERVTVVADGSGEWLGMASGLADALEQSAPSSSACLWIGARVGGGSAKPSSRVWEVGRPRVDTTCFICGWCPPMHRPSAFIAGLVLKRPVEQGPSHTRPGSPKCKW